jgi:hypothetical protein
MKKFLYYFGCILFFPSAIIVSFSTIAFSFITDDIKDGFKKYPKENGIVNDNLARLFSEAVIDFKWITLLCVCFIVGSILISINLPEKK